MPPEEVTLLGLLRDATDSLGRLTDIVEGQDQRIEALEQRLDELLEREEVVTLIH